MRAFRGRWRISGIESPGSRHGDWRPPVAGVAALGFEAFATAVSWRAWSGSRGFDVPQRVAALIATGLGVALWWRYRRETGRLVVIAAAASFVRDLRFSGNAALFVFGFCFAFVWLAVVAHLVVAWPRGSLSGTSERLLVAMCYILSAGSQIARYLADRPLPGWLYTHPPNTMWTHVGSACVVVMALVLVVFVVRRWVATARSQQAAEPVWIAVIVVAVSASAAAAGSIAGVPDGQIELVPMVLAVAMAAPAGWVYVRMNHQLREVRASRRRVATAAMEERRRIQADLHDGAQQSFAAVQVRLESAMRALGAATTPERIAFGHGELNRARRELGLAIESLRELVQQIYPSVLQEYGLHVALEQVADRSAIPLLLDIAPNRWSAQVELTAYLAVTEAVANCMRHARPTRISVTVSEDGDTVVVYVRDDGAGTAAPLHDGGLRSLQDRAAVVGGSVGLDSDPSWGTQVTIRLPKEPPRARRAD